MKTIQSYAFKPESGQQPISLPLMATIINAVCTNGVAQIIAEVNTNEPEKQSRTLGIYQTGEEKNEFDLSYINSIEVGGTMLHIYENK